MSNEVSYADITAIWTEGAVKYELTGKGRIELTTVEREDAEIVDSHKLLPPPVTSQGMLKVWFKEEDGKQYNVKATKRPVVSRQVITEVEQLPSSEQAEHALRDSLGVPWSAIRHSRDLDTVWELTYNWKDYR